MNTKIKSEKLREKYTLEKNPQINEIEFAITDTKKEIEALKNIENDNPPILLEIELAKIFGLSSDKITKIKAEHIPKRQLTIASVMNDFETFLNMKKI
jgi:hypothetical protein